MKFKLLDVVVLQEDLPSKGLKSGDLGAVVELFDGDGMDVEFVTASGKTEAVVTLKPSDVRPVANNDLIAVRTFSGAA